MIVRPMRKLQEHQKEGILFLLHRPPPFHGSSIAGEQIYSITALHKEFDAVWVNLNTSTETDRIGKFDLIKILRYFRILSQSLLALIQRRPKLAYVAITASGVAFFKDAFLVLIIRAFRVPILFHLHNKGISRRFHSVPDKWLYRLVFTKSKVILLSKYLLPDLCGLVSESSVFYCPYGVQDRADRFHNRRKGGVPTILYLSNLIRSKGVFVLLESCRILRKRGLDFRCIFVGGEGDICAEEFRDEVHRLGLGMTVDYLGRKIGGDKDNLFSEADIFALPTYYPFECLPISILEAMQWSLPVVATAEGAIKESVLDGMTGYIVPQQDSETLADKLELLLRDPNLRQRMGESGRRRYEKYFTAEKFEERAYQLLTTLLKSN